MAKPKKPELTGTSAQRSLALIQVARDLKCRLDQLLAAVAAFEGEGSAAEREARLRELCEAHPFEQPDEDFDRDFNDRVLAPLFDLRGALDGHYERFLAEDVRLAATWDLLLLAAQAIELVADLAGRPASLDDALLGVIDQVAAYRTACGKDHAPGADRYELLRDLKEAIDGHTNYRVRLNQAYTVLARGGPGYCDSREDGSRNRVLRACIDRLETRGR